MTEFPKWLSSALVAWFSFITLVGFYIRMPIYLETLIAMLPMYVVLIINIFKK